MSWRQAWHAARVRRWLRECTTTGAAPQVIGRPSVHVEGGQLHIGHRFRLASIPVASHIIVGAAGTMRVGDDVSIGCGAAIAAQELVTIGDGTCIGPYVIIMDTNFHGGAGDQSLQHDCRPVAIGRGCRIGSRVTITRGVTIGDGAEILAGSVVTSAVPAGACVAGGRARIIGRAGEAASRWDSLAATLPETLAAALGLGSPPDLDDTPLPAQLWTAECLPQVMAALELRLGVAINSAALRDARTYAELAAALHSSRSGQAALTTSAAWK